PRVEEPAPATYIEGGERDANEPLLARLRTQLQGVKSVSIQAGAMQDELTKSVQHELPNLAVADGADVAIRFDGTLEHIGRGRKRRAAQASIVKNGRVIFRYE